MAKYSVGILCVVAILGAQSLTLTTPNGGEQWIVGNKHPIHWDWTGTIAWVRLEYSTDGGQNWIIIASSTQNDGSYLWTIPNTLFSTCFVRISDVASPGTNDMSDGSFSIIRPSIDVKKPDGGEILQIGEYCPVHWDWTGVFSGVKIEYSTDGGSSWSYIVSTTTNDGDHYWQVPDAPSNNCFVKVTNTADNNCYGISDNSFTIASNTITVVNPNGGEALTTGAIYPIYWDWTGTFSSVKIEYSTDGGSTWTQLIASTPNDGSHYWTIPNQPSDYCRIQVSNVADPTCTDMSDNDFSILSTGLQITHPDGGETFFVGDYCPIHWNWTGTISSVKLEYSSDGGATWNLIIGSTNNDGDYNWTVSNSPSSQCRIRITNLNDPTCFDVSNANFTIERPQFTIIDPDSGVSLIAGETCPVHWNWRGAASSVKLELWYKTQTGVQWWTITASTPNDGSHYFTVPYYISDSCGIKLTSNDDPNCVALSEVFHIIRPTITVLHPNGGEHYIEGHPLEIIWQAGGDINAVMLQYSIDGGTNWQTITTSTSNDGSYSWFVPSGAYDVCRVKVINTLDIDCYDTSDGDFFIDDASITITRPAASDTFFIKKKHPIYWKYTGFFPTVTIRYSSDNGASWQTITTTQGNDGRYVWAVDTLTSATALISVTSNQNTAVCDSSDVFVIADTTFLVDNFRILSPLANDSFYVGGFCHITWHSIDFAPPNQVSISYSINNGPWIHIANVYNATREHLWTIPNYVTDSCRIRIMDINGSDTTYSDYFTIVPQKIFILSPNSAKQWMVGCRHFIHWYCLGNFQNAVIDYSYNGGTDWVNIVSPTVNDGGYEWTIPNAPSDQCLIRIRNYENLNIVAISDTFSIIPQTIKTTSPTAGANFYVGRKYFVTWDYTGVFPLVNIEYSIDGGSSWTPVANDISNNQRYEWTIPNATSNFALVRVINSANLNVYGISDTFAIIPQTITVSSPALNNQWVIGRKYFVTWWYTGAFSNARIEYSTNNGFSWSPIADNITNNRYYEWTIPNTPSDLCRVKVSNCDDLAVFGISDLFRIPLQVIDINSPTSGDNLLAGRKYYITWTWSGTLSQVDIEYSSDNGSTWNYIVDNTTNNGRYEWTAPAINSDSCRVKVTNSQNESIYDISDMFAIVPQEITITSPVTDDTMRAGRKYYLTWRTRGTFSNADIWYSVNGGLTWTQIASNITNYGYYEWSLPEILSVFAQIKVANTAQPTIFAESDTFTIALPILEITSPILGHTWYATRKYFISWNDLAGIAQVNLLYSLDGGASWNQIVANQTNQRYYEWTIPDSLLSDNARVRLVSSANSNIAYVSDSFVIAALGIDEFASLPWPTEFSLQGFIPNPFSNRGTILLAVPSRIRVRVMIYDVCGRLMDKVYDDMIEPGYQRFSYQQQLASGVYFLRVTAEEESKMIYENTIKIVKTQ